MRFVCLVLRLPCVLDREGSISTVRRTYIDGYGYGHRHVQRNYIVAKRMLREGGCAGQDENQVGLILGIGLFHHKPSDSERNFRLWRMANEDAIFQRQVFLPSVLAPEA